MRMSHGLAAIALAGFVVAAPQATSAAPAGSAFKPAVQRGVVTSDVVEVGRRWRRGYRRGWRRGYRGYYGYPYGYRSYGYYGYPYGYRPYAYYGSPYVYRRYGYYGGGYPYGYGRGYYGGGPGISLYFGPRGGWW